MKQACMLKFRDIVAETVSEYNRRGEFIRIFPSRNSKMYDRFFSSGRSSLNKIVYKALYSNELLPYSTQIPSDGQLISMQKQFEHSMSKTLAPTKLATLP